MQVGAAGTPPAAVELADRGDQHLHLVGPVDPLLGAPHRQLPADVRLGLQRVQAGTLGQAVQGAAGAAGEARPVEEDAGAVDGAGAPIRTTLSTKPNALRSASFCRQV